MNPHQEEPTNPERDDSVARAVASLQRFYDSQAARGDVPRARFRKSTPDGPCQVIPDHSRETR